MKILNLAALILLAQTAFGQIKFYANESSTATTSIDYSVDALKLVVTIPETAKNHESIVIQYEDEPETGDGWNAYYWKKEFSAAFLQGKTKLSFWLKKPGESEGEFCRGDYCNKLFTEKDSYKREYTSQPLRVQIYGKDFSKVVWENGEQVKKYRFTLLKSADLQIEYGPIFSAVKSDEGLFQLEKFNASEDSRAELFSNTGQVYMTYNLFTDNGGVDFGLAEVEVGESSEVAIDMSGGGGSSSAKSSNPMEEVKTSIERKLFLKVNERSRKYIDKPATEYYNESISESVFEPMLKAKGAVRNHEKEAKRFDNRADYMSWKPGKIGNFEGDLLEIPVYKMSQMKFDSQLKVYKLKDGEKGKTQTLKVVVGKVDDRIFVATLAAKGTNKLSEEEMGFWNHIENTFKLN